MMWIIIISIILILLTIEYWSFWLCLLSFKLSKRINKHIYYFTIEEGYGLSTRHGDENNYVMRVYMADNILPFGAGYYAGRRNAFINNNPNSWNNIKHEYHHVTQRERLGFFGYWFTMYWAYLLIFKPHDKKQLEREAEEAENK